MTKETTKFCKECSLPLGKDSTGELCDDCLALKKRIKAIDDNYKSKYLR